MVNVTINVILSYKVIISYMLYADDLVYVKPMDTPTAETELGGDIQVITDFFNSISLFLLKRNVYCFNFKLYNRRDRFLIFFCEKVYSHRKASFVSILITALMILFL